MNPLHLPRLQSLHHENPTRRISLIRLIWPDIEKALARGHTLKLIHTRLVEDGIRISYTLLCLYVHRLQGKANSNKDQPRPSVATKTISTTPGVDGHSESRGIGREQGPPVPAPAPNPSVWPKRRGLMRPWELNANNENEGCFFKERVPDINELFRVTKST